jgi:hypothetical protein
MRNLNLPVTSMIMWKLVVLPKFRKYMLPPSSRLILYSINRMVFVTETQKMSSVFNYYLEGCRTAKGLFASSVEGVIRDDKM